AGERLGVQALDVAPRALVERRGDVDLDEALADHLADGVTRLGVGRDGGDDDAGAVARQQLGDEADAQDVGVAVLAREAEALAQVGAADVAVQMLDEDAAPLELGADDLGDRALAGTGQAGEPEGESMVFLWHLWRSFRSCSFRALCSASAVVEAALHLSR